MNSSPIKIRTIWNNSHGIHLSATLRISFGPGIHDTRCLHYGEIIAPPEDPESPAVRERLRARLAEYVSDAIRRDEWGLDSE